MADEPLNQTDMVVLEVLALMLGGSVILEPAKQGGINEALRHLVSEFANRGQNKAAALVEQIRLKSADNRSDPALLNLLRKNPPGLGQAN